MINRSWTTNRHIYRKPFVVGASIHTRRSFMKSHEQFMTHESPSWMFMTSFLKSFSVKTLRPRCSWRWWTNRFIFYSIQADWYRPYRHQHRPRRRPARDISAKPKQAVSLPSSFRRFAGSVQAIPRLRRFRKTTPARHLPDRPSRPRPLAGHQLRAVRRGGIPAKRIQAPPWPRPPTSNKALKNLKNRSSKTHPLPRRGRGLRWGGEINRMDLRQKIGRHGKGI